MPSKKMPLVFIILAFVLLGALAFAAKFVIGGFLHEREVYASLRTQISDIQAKRDQLAIAQASAQNVNNDVSRVKQAFVGQNDVLNILIPLEREAANEGINGYKVAVAQDITSSTASKNSSAVLPGTTLRIEGNGGLSSLFAFMRTLQGLPYFLRIESLQFQQAGASSSATAPLQMIIIVKFFSLANE